MNILWIFQCISARWPVHALVPDALSVTEQIKQPEVRRFWSIRPQWIMQNVLKSYRYATQHILDKLRQWNEVISYFAKPWRSWEVALEVPARSQSLLLVTGGSQALWRRWLLLLLENIPFRAAPGDLQAETLKFTVARFSLLDEISVSPEHKTCCGSQQDVLLRSPAKCCWRCRGAMLIRHRVGHGSSGYRPALRHSGPGTVGMRDLVLQGHSRGFRRKKIYPLPIPSSRVRVRMTHVLLALFDEGAGGGSEKGMRWSQGTHIQGRDALNARLELLKLKEWRTALVGYALSSSWLRRALVDIWDRPWIMVDFVIAFLSLVNRLQEWDRIQAMVHMLWLSPFSQDAAGCCLTNLPSVFHNARKMQNWLFTISGFNFCCNHPSE